MVFQNPLLTFEKHSNWTRVLPAFFCNGHGDFQQKGFLEKPCLWFFTKICRPFRFRLKFDKSRILTWGSIYMYTIWPLLFFIIEIVFSVRYDLWTRRNISRSERNRHVWLTAYHHNCDISMLTEYRIWLTVNLLLTYDNMLKCSTLCFLKYSKI